MFAINCDKVSAFSYLIGLNTQMCARFDTYISYKNWISVHPPRVRVQGVKSLGGHFAFYAGGLNFMK